MSHILVCRLQEVRPHPNADRLQVAFAAGSRVVVSKSMNEGDLVLFFSPDVQLSQEYCAANNLLRGKDENGKPTGGFFEDDRRVRCLSMRGVKTEGYVASLASLDFAGTPKDLREGDRIQSWQGVPLCEKYLTPATRRLLRKREKRGLGQIREVRELPRHFDTEPLKRMLASLPPLPGLIILTEKMHGTSGRTARVSLPTTPAPRFWQSPLRWLAWKAYHALFGLVPPPWLSQTKILTGSRNVLFLESPDGGSYFADESFREEAIAAQAVHLKEGEAWYYEIVGYQKGDALIMSPQPTSRIKDEAIRAYGDKMQYKYGCNEGEAKAFVYRMTESLPGAPPRDVPYTQMVARALEVGLRTPPLLAPIQWSQNVRSTLATLDIEALASGPSTLDPSHIREGVCVRIELLGDKGVQIYKVKSHEFGVLEGYLKDNPDAVDREESA